MHETEQLMKTDADINMNNDTSERKVIIFDGMAIVKRIKKNMETLRCKDLSDAFIRLVLHQARVYGDLRMTFNR